MPQNPSLPLPESYVNVLYVVHLRTDAMRDAAFTGAGKDFMKSSRSGKLLEEPTFGKDLGGGVSYQVRYRKLS